MRLDDAIWAAKASAERRVLLEALVRARGNVAAAARLLDRSRPHVHAMLRKHEIHVADVKEMRRELRWGANR